MALMAKTIRRGRIPQQGTSKAVHMAAPVGGINTVTAASAMPPSDCLYLYNMIPFQYGLRVRSGYREWATGLTLAETSTGLVDYGSPLAFGLSAPLGGPMVGQWTSHNPFGVRTLLAFNGSATDGSNDRLWAVTNTGIWDVTNPTDAPVKVYSFPDMGLPNGPAQAGRGVGTSFVSGSGDHYYCYCDGAHGYHLYSENSQVWNVITMGNTPGQQIESADPAVYGTVDPATFRFVMQWKSRLWFVPEGSTTAWYLDIGSFTGLAYPMPFAPRFKSGGELVGLWAWTVDGGVGIDDHLVAISRGGDVVIYSGTDPSIPGAFALRGVWWVGRPPPGRNIASTFGGDLFILSVVGCVPLSRLVSGGLIRDPEILASAKLSNLFNRLMTARGDNGYWSIGIHPTDNMMIVNVPPTPSEPRQQLTMSLANQGWAQHLGVPMSCMETWRNKLYFGTEDGRVCVNDGEVDDLLLDKSSLRPIEWALLTSYQNLGSPNKKRVHMVRPHFMTDGTNPAYSVGARFDFDLSPIDLAPVAADATPSAWDIAKWDQSVWGDGAGIAGRYQGASGMGSHVALVLRGNSITNTTFVGFDAVLDQGGIL